MSEMGQSRHFDRGPARSGLPRSTDKARGPAARAPSYHFEGAPDAMLAARKAGKFASPLKGAPVESIASLWMLNVRPEATCAERKRQGVMLRRGFTEALIRSSGAARPSIKSPAMTMPSESRSTWKPPHRRQTELRPSAPTTRRAR
jgi:hypothetical protein